MDITRLIEALREDLDRAAAVGGDEARAAADRLSLALEPALRLTLMEALSQAAAEIGDALPGVAIDVRLSGRDPLFVVEGAAHGGGAEAFEPDDGENDARVTLRLPEALKTRAEAMAARRGQSLNPWLVAAVRAAASDNHGPGRHGGRRLQGWVK